MAENELVKVITLNGVEQSTAIAIKTSFLPFFEQAKEWSIKSSELVVTDITQVDKMEDARIARLALRDIRVKADKTRKALKEDSIKYGKAVQGVYNMIEDLIVPAEKYLETQENFARIEAAAAEARLKAERDYEAQPYIEFIPFGIDLGSMEQIDYDKLLNGAKLQQTAKIEADKKAEEEKIAAAKAKANEDERIRKENEVLKEQQKAKEIELQKQKDEALAKELALKKEREAIEKKARIEREKATDEKKKLEDELKVKQELIDRAEKERREKEAKELAAKQEAERKAKAAPDKEKLLELSKRIREINRPSLGSDSGKIILSSVNILLEKVAVYIDSHVEKL